MKTLGLDYGGRRIGISLSDDTGRVAMPHSVLITTPDSAKEIGAIVAREGVIRIVLGESRNFKNEPNPIMDDISRFKEELAGITQVPIHYELEMLTSAMARRVEGEHAKLDASAAALILQSFLDREYEISGGGSR